MPIALSNLDIYLAIAEESIAESHQFDAASRIPKPDGQPGYIVTLDPNSASFKKSLISLAFAGVYFDALLFLAGTASLGKAGYSRIERNKTYEQKLELLTISDAKTLAECKRFRLARNDLMHEKATSFEDFDLTRIHFAQTEAEFGLSFVKKVRMRLCQISDFR